MSDPKVGEDGLVFEDRPLPMSVLQALPTEVGLWKTSAVYTNIEANDSYLVVGSEQGVVWVVDLETSTLIREYSEFRGTSITVLKLCPTRDLLAYGTNDGHIRIEKVAIPVSNKWRIQEKGKQAVRALEWKGDHLFCGFDMGRVVQIKINIHEGTLSPLTFPGNYGSTVTQLSCKGNTLLVSTVERTWVVNTETHKLEQVGRKDRKPGQYGGCLVQGGDRAFVARPGLRLWTADNTGKVLSTVVFKEALSSQHLPRVPLHSWSSIVPSYNKTWQFSSVWPWVGEHFVVTLSGHTLFILDPENGLTVGVLTLGHQVTDLTITRSFVYILCSELKKPICRISVKQSFLRALKKAFPVSPAHTPTPSKKLLSLETATAGTASALTVHSHTEAFKTRQDGRLRGVERPREDTDRTKDTQSSDKVLPSISDGVESHDSHVTSDDTAESEKANSTLDSAIAGNSLCGYMGDDSESLDGTTQDTRNEEPDLNSDLQSHTAADPSDLNSDLQSHTTAEPSVQESESTLPDRMVSASPNTPADPMDSPTVECADPTTPPSEPSTAVEPLTHTSPLTGSSDALLLADMVDTIPSSGEGSRASLEDEAGPEQSTQSESVTVTSEPNTQLDSVSEEPAASTLEQSKVSTHDTAEESSGESKDTSESGTSTHSEQSDKGAEPTLQEALQNVKAEMKELLKPGFDKLSNIFKGANPGPHSPNRIRVLASRSKKNGNDEAESHDLNVVIEENKSADSQANTSKDDPEPKKPDLKEIFKIGIGTLLNKEAGVSSHTPQEETPTIITPLDPEEQERRLRMSQSRPEEEDDVVVIKKDKKKKRKRKYKKLSSATSSVSVSLERLTEIEEENDDCPTPLSITTPLSRTTSPCVPFMLTEEQTTRLEQLKMERNEESNSNEREQCVLESLPENHPEEMVEHDEPTSAAPPSLELGLEEPVKQDQPDEQSELGPIIEADTPTGQTEAPTFKTATTPPPPSEAVPSESAIPEPRVETDYVPLFADDDTPPEPPRADKPSLEVTLSKSSSPGLVDSRGESHEKSMTTTLGDLSDNPLYHDSDPESEQTPSTAPSSMTASPIKHETGDSRSRSTATRYQASLLQPVKVDPLQSDDSFEGAFGGNDKLVDATPVTLRTRRSSDSESPKKQHGRRDRPTAVVSGSWTHGYIPIRGGRDLSAEASDSSHDEDEELNADDSLVVPDFYKLCGSLVRHSNQNKEAKASTTETRKFSWAATEFPRESIAEPDDEEPVGEGPACNSDIWVPIPHPGRSNVQCICLSDVLLWVVDGRGSVFCTTMNSKGKDWQLIKPSMTQVCSSPSGKIVWGVHHQNAYVRLGIGVNPAGTTWMNTTKGTFMSKKIKRLAVSDNAVWGITTDNRTIFRKEVDQINPDGRMWQEIPGEGFTHISCSKNIVWAHTSLGKVFIRDGITLSMPSGRKWMECKCPKLTASCLTSAGVAWGINSEGSIGFRSGVTQSKPSGQGAWWEVKINALTHPTSPYNSLWQVMGSEGSHLLTSVLPHLTQHSKPLLLSASSKSGVIILQDGNRLHACWRTTTGYHYRPASKNGLFPVTVWLNIAAGNTGLWLVRDDGDLHCLTANDKLKRIECPAAIKYLAASTTCLWIVADNLLWSRQGLSQDVPEGVSFDYIEVSPQLHERKIRCITCGNSAVWALDQTGVPHFRFGVHSREPGTGMSPAWIPVDDIPSPLLQISVCEDNWLVWACDEKLNSYVRAGVTKDFPIGTKWELVPGEQLKEVCVTNEYVYGLTPNGELLCRYGISEENIQGNYWRRMPGRYEHLATGRFGELWTLDSKGQVWRQEWKVLAVSQDPKAGQDDFETSMVVDQSWEVV